MNVALSDSALDITEVVVLDHITAILYKLRLVSTIWRDMAVEHEFQALTLAEAWEEIRAYEARSHKPIRGRGRPKAMKPCSPGFDKAPIGLDYSPREFQQRRGKN